MNNYVFINFKNQIYKIFKFHFNEEDSFKNPPSFIINYLF